MSDNESYLKGNFLPCLAIFMAVFILYGHTLSFDLVVFDDNILSDSPLYSSLSAIPQLFRQDVFGDGSRFYRPFLSISFLFDSILKMPGHFSFHLSNLMFHAAACILMFFFLLENGFARNISLPLSLLFAVHPALSQAVAWLPGRNDSVLSCLIIAAMLSAGRFLSCCGNGRFFGKNGLKQLLWLAAHLLLFAAALFTKETAVILPAVILAWEYFAGKLFPVKKIMPVFIAQAFALAVYFIARSHAASGSADIEFLESLKGLLLIPVFFFKAFLSADLNVYKRWAYFSWPALFLFMAIISAGFYLTEKNSRKKYVFGIISAFLFLAPTFAKTKGIFPFFLSHRFYLPAVFMFFSLASMLEGKKIVSGYAAKAVYAVVFLFFCLNSFIQCSYFKDTYIFWEQACVEMPGDFTAQAMTAMNYYDRRMIKPAAIYARRALEINPRHEDMNMVLGVYAASQGEIKQALDFMKKEIANNPGNKTAADLLPQLESIVSQGIFQAEVNIM